MPVIIQWNMKNKLNSRVYSTQFHHTHSSIDKRLLLQKRYIQSMAYVLHYSPEWFSLYRTWIIYVTVLHEAAVRYSIRAPSASSRCKITFWCSLLHNRNNIFFAEVHLSLTAFYLACSFASSRCLHLLYPVMLSSFMDTPLWNMRR